MSQGNYTRWWGVKRITAAMVYDVVIVGAGPGGLACAKRVAGHGLATLVLERRPTIGGKVCAGGITWNGLLKNNLGSLCEKSFPRQRVRSRWQRIEVSAPTPIVATINRERLGKAMAEEARAAGADIRTDHQVSGIVDGRVYCTRRGGRSRETFTCSHVVGADGSSSLVRRALRLPVRAIGTGIHYQLPGDLAEMEWHLDHRLFGNGYAWVFPHRHSFSLGAYADSRAMGANRLHHNLLRWGQSQGHGPALAQARARAGRINYDFRGWRFGRTFLVGDAAGLASGLTGEGIYSAIISGVTVAETIANPHYPGDEMARLIKSHARHRRAVAISGSHPAMALLLAEVMVLALRTRLVNFSAAEMAR